MLPDKKDASHLWDILDAARAIEQFVEGCTYQEYARSAILQAAVERKIEIIGEAARRLSGAFKQRHADIPWKLVIAQRNVLAHEYGEINQERIWNVVVEHIPELIAVIEPLLPPRLEDTVR